MKLILCSLQKVDRVRSLLSCKVFPVPGVSGLYRTSTLANVGLSVSRCWPYFFPYSKSKNS